MESSWSWILHVLLCITVCECCMKAACPAVYAACECCITLHVMLCITVCECCMKAACPSVYAACECCITLHVMLCILHASVVWTLHDLLCITCMRVVWTLLVLLCILHASVVWTLHVLLCITAYECCMNAACPAVYHCMRLYMHVLLCVLHASVVWTLHVLLCILHASVVWTLHVLLCITAYECCMNAACPAVYSVCECRISTYTALLFRTLCYAHSNIEQLSQYRKLLIYDDFWAVCG